MPKRLKQILNCRDQKINTLLLLAALVLGTTAFTPQVETRGPQRLDRKLRVNVSQEYILQLPANYDQQRRYPLLIAVHWDGGSAEQMYDVWKAEADRDQVILLCPQFSEGYGSLAGREDVRLMQVLIEVQKEFSYEDKQVFIFGFAAGAQFAQRFAFKHPNIVGAAAVFAADDYEEPPKLARNRRVRFFVAAGEQDVEKYLNRVKVAQRFFRQLQGYRYDVVLKLYPGAGHVLTPEMVNDVRAFFNDILAGKTK